MRKRIIGPVGFRDIRREGLADTHDQQNLPADQPQGRGFGRQRGRTTCGAATVQVVVSGRGTERKSWPHRLPKNSSHVPAKARATLFIFFLSSFTRHPFLSSHQLHLRAHLRSPCVRRKSSRGTRTRLWSRASASDWASVQARPSCASSAMERLACRSVSMRAAVCPALELTRFKSRPFATRMSSSSRAVVPSTSSHQPSSVLHSANAAAGSMTVSWSCLS